MSKKKRKMGKTVVIWAVDPFEDPTKPSALAIKSLDRWAGEMGLALQPVYVASLFPEDAAKGELFYLDRLEKKLDSFVEKYRIQNALHGEVLIDELGSRPGAVQALLAYAQKYSSAWIALSSHGRSGFKRFLFGSFAEAVLREAKVPVLFLSKQSLRSGSNRVLFPTDFSRESRRAFRSFLPIASRLHFELTIFHAVSLPVPAYMEAAEGIPPAYIPENYFPDKKIWASKQGKAWLERAEQAGVKARLMVLDEGVGLITGDTILAAAKRAGAGMVAMASESRPIDRLLIGSAAHETFRANRLAVWMFGPKALRWKAPPMPAKDISPEEKSNFSLRQEVANWE